MVNLIDAARFLFFVVHIISFLPIWPPSEAATSPGNKLGKRVELWTSGFDASSSVHYIPAISLISNHELAVKLSPDVISRRNHVSYLTSEDTAIDKLISRSGYFHPMQYIATVLFLYQTVPLWPCTLIVIFYVFFHLHMIYFAHRIQLPAYWARFARR